MCLLLANRKIFSSNLTLSSTPPLKPIFSISPSLPQRHDPIYCGGLWQQHGSLVICKPKVSRPPPSCHIFLIFLGLTSCLLHVSSLLTLKPPPTRLIYCRPMFPPYCLLQSCAVEDCPYWQCVEDLTGLFREDSVESLIQSLSLHSPRPPSTLDITGG
jgi:hypothetical protein